MYVLSLGCHKPTVWGNSTVGTSIETETLPGLLDFFYLWTRELEDGTIECYTNHFQHGTWDMFQNALEQRVCYTLAKKKKKKILGYALSDYGESLPQFT